MNTLHALHDAFQTLEERADAARIAPPDIAVRREHAGQGRPTLTRYAAPAAAAAAVVAVAGGVTLWQHDQSGRPAHQPAAHGSTSAALSTPAHTAPAHPAQYVPPTTVAQLTAQARAILGRLATITVDPNRSDNCGAVTMTVPSGPGKPELPNGATPSIAGQPTKIPPSECSGVAIAGHLTSAGRTGGFDLDVFAATPDGDTEWPGATVRTLPDGSTLVTDTWHDTSVPGGVTYSAELIRPDGADISMHVSTESDPKGQSGVTASRVPLTLEQMTAFVTSDRW